jgi:hypothetical protein
MPKWTVEGADKQSGLDLTSTIEAPTEARARQEAAGKGILVSSIHRSEMDPLDTITAVAEQLQRIGNTSIGMHSADLAPARAPAGAPHYKKILTGSKVLEIFGLLFLLLGALSAVAALGFGVLWIVELARAETVQESTKWIVLASALAAVTTLTIGALLRMTGSLGLAVRDLARNSFCE